MKKTIAFSGLFLLFTLAGGLWIGLLRMLPEGLPRAVAVLGLGCAFVGVYMTLLVSRVRKILSGDRHFVLQLLMLLLELAVLLAGFALMHEDLGLIDNTRPGSPIAHDFWLSLYYSAITFTTVGYGDLYPVGLGRALAALQGLTGYVVLGVLASTAASLVSPYSPAGPESDEDEE